jgi:hypothetical protein
MKEKPGLIARPGTKKRSLQKPYFKGVSDVAVWLEVIFL